MGNFRQRIIEKHRLKIVPQEHDDPLSTNPKEVSPDNPSAVEHIAARISWPETKTLGVYDALVKMAHQDQSDYAAVKRAVLCAAVGLVLKRKEEPQPIRIGKNWVNGSQEPIAPIFLNAEDFSKWVEQETREAACALALQRPYPDTEKGEREFKALLAHLNAEDRTWDSKDQSTRLTTSLRDFYSAGQNEADEDDEEYNWYLDDNFGGEALYRAVEELSPSEKELIKAIETGEGWASVARRTGKKAGSVRQEAKRLKEKMRRRQSELAEEVERERSDSRRDEEYDRVYAEAEAETTQLWDEHCRADPKFERRTAMRWMVHPNYIDLPIMMDFRDYSDKKMRAPSRVERERLDGDVRRIVDRICDLARAEWITYKARRITYKRMGWEE